MIVSRSESREKKLQDNTFRFVNNIYIKVVLSKILSASDETNSQECSLILVVP